MTTYHCPAFLRKAVFGATMIAALAPLAPIRAQGDDDEDSRNASQVVSSGVRITPRAAPGSGLLPFNPGLSGFPDYHPSGAITTVLSPDHQTLLALLSGYNVLNGPDGNPMAAASNEYVFVYDVARGNPVQKQVIPVPNTFAGIAFDPQGTVFYVGGAVDDNVHSYALQPDGRWAESDAPIPLGHQATHSLTGKDTKPATAGLAVTPDGKTLVVANLYNDSVSLVDLAARAVIAEVDLRPGATDPSQQGVPGGEYPFWVAIKGKDTAYVSSLRDRQIVVVKLGNQPRVADRIKVKGSPNRMIFNQAQTRLYVASEFEDVVSVIDATCNRVVATMPTLGPDYLTATLKPFHGSVPVALALSPDESTLYVANAGTNCLEVIGLHGSCGFHIAGLIPTTFYPNCLSVSGDGKWLYVVNQKSPTTPNPQEVTAAANQYMYQLEKSSLLTLPVPDASSLEQLTLTVAANNRFTAPPRPRDERVMAELRRRIHHVIYIVKENRTYDQILGDLDQGNGDPSLTQFGEAITPNFHQIARRFVNLDNFYAAGDVSADGWPWSTAAIEADWNVKATALNYSGRGFSYDAEGANRNINVGYPTVAQRVEADPLTQNDPNLLPGQADVAAPDGPCGQEGKGYLWDAALRKGLSLRDYGFYCDLTRYAAQTPAPYRIPLERDPHAAGLQVTFPTKPELQAHFDPYFRAYDNAFPDFYREREWEREFDGFDANGGLPALSLVRFMHDHTGAFDTAIDGVNTPETQQADNDYAVARLIERVAHSRYKGDTLIFIVEDDAQDGADHVDAHRTTAYVVGPYVRQGALVSRHYTTVNLIRTMEDVLGLEHLNVYTATFRPMTACFDLQQQAWDFHARPSAFLVNGTQLPIPKSAAPAEAGRSTHDAAYWAERTAEFDFSKEDNLKNPDKYNRIIWEGLKGNVPYPVGRTGADLRVHRAELLRKVGVAGVGQ